MTDLTNTLEISYEDSLPKVTAPGIELQSLKKKSMEYVIKGSEFGRCCLLFLVREIGGAFTQIGPSHSDHKTRYKITVRTKSIG